MAWLFALAGQASTGMYARHDARYLQWLPDSQTILRYDKHPAEVQRAFDEADLVFCLDFNGAGRLDEMQDVLTGCRARKVMIDHHLAPCMDVDLQISQPHMSSASELVFRIVWQLGGFEQMDRKWAACVYCGMMTDTAVLPTIPPTLPSILLSASCLPRASIKTRSIAMYSITAAFLPSVFAVI